MIASRTRYRVHLAFWLAALLMMALLGWAIYNSTAGEARGTRWVVHTQDVLQQVAKVGELMNRADSAQRRYLLSANDPSLLSERDVALQEVRETVTALKEMTSDNPDQQRRLSELETLVDARAAIMQESVRLRGLEGGVEAIQSRASNSPSRETTERIYALTAEMRHAELALLDLRGQDADRHRNIGEGLLIAAVLVGLVVLIPGYLGFILQTRALKQTERKLRVMADSLPGAMYQLKIDPSGKEELTFLSAGVNKVRGTRHYPDNALPEWRAMVDAVDERDRPGFLAAMAEATRSVGPFSHDYRVGFADGSLRWLHHEASVLKEDDGSILVNGYVTDVSEKRRLQDALEDAKEVAVSANRAKSTFLATMSHEIRTPMNGVLGMLELLGLTRLDPPQRSTLAIAHESSKSLLRIIDDILDFSKIEAGKLDIRTEVASIDEMLRRVYDIYSGNARSIGLALKRSTDPRISPALRVDPLRLRQILNNFVSNAIKFTPRGSVEIRAELVDRVAGTERIRLSVKDTGIGISAANQQRLFEAFSQVAEDRSPRAGGTGLGLTISRRLADMMGGSVEMVSELGKGTTMILTLSLPIADPKDLPKSDLENAREMSRDVRRAPPTAEEAELEGTLVLVVDDHPTNRTLLVRQVCVLGYAAESAGSGIEALEMWASGRFALVITDCNMPGMDGYELSLRIRELESRGGRKHTPIISCSADALDGESEACLAAGMDDCLVKPVALSRMLEKLDRWLPIPGEAASPPRSSSASGADAATAAPVDRSVLAEISGGSAATEHEILAEFRRTNDEDAANLDRAVAASDAAEVTRAVHRMVGASRTVGALGFASVCERIGHASRASDSTSVSAGMAAFHRELTSLNTYLDAH
jgi:signal transduction histidine kinase/DNA-binding response OmpR family regulator